MNKGSFPRTPFSKHFYVTFIFCSAKSERGGITPLTCTMDKEVKENKEVKEF